METVEQVQELHHQEEEAYLLGDNNRMQAISAELDLIVTDELAIKLEGEQNG